MKENSIEEDIKILETWLEELNELFNKTHINNTKERNALYNILKEYNMEYKRILDLADNRIYRKKYLEERRKEQPNLLYPDSDEIYQRYYELKQENEELKKINEQLSENKLLQDIEIKKNFISIQKVKDKIKSNKEIINETNDGDLIHELYQENKVLQELLEERGDSK